MAPLKKNDKVKEKARPYRLGIIKRAQASDATGLLTRDRHRWIVEFVNADGSTVEEEKKSRQLNQVPAPKAPQQEADEEPPQQTERVHAPPPAPPQTRGHSRRHQDEQSLSASPTRTPTSSSPASIPRSVHTSFHGSEAGETESIELVLEDDDGPVPAVITVTDDQEPTQEPTPPSASNPNDLTEDVPNSDDADFESEAVHKERSNVYKQKKAELLEQGWTIEMPQDRPSFEIGVRVETKAGRRNGTQQ